MNEIIFVPIVVRNHSFYSISEYFLTNVYEINHLWEEQKWNQMKNDTHSCECNLCNCVRSLKKNLGLQWDLNQWPCDTGVTLWPTKPWSHWCWELVNYVFKCSHERDECDNCIWNKSVKYILKQWIVFFVHSDWLLKQWISCAIHWFISSSSERGTPNSRKFWEKCLPSLLPLQTKKFHN